MLRLTRTTPSPSEIVLKAEGQIVGEWVGLLEAECRDLMESNGSGRKILLDFGDVSYPGIGGHHPLSATRRRASH